MLHQKRIQETVPVGRGGVYLYAEMASIDKK